LKYLLVFKCIPDSGTVNHVIDPAQEHIRHFCGKLLNEIIISIRLPQRAIVNREALESSIDE